MGALLNGAEHQAIMAAGWAYRANERGWVIYRDPQTGLWHTRSDAIAILFAADAMNTRPPNSCSPPLSGRTHR